MINRVVVLCLCASAQFLCDRCGWGARCCAVNRLNMAVVVLGPPFATDGRLRGPSFANTVSEMDGLISPFRGPERSSCLGLSSRNCLSEFAPLTLCLCMCVCGFNNAFTMKLIGSSFHSGTTGTLTVYCTILKNTKLELFSSVQNNVRALCYKF